VLHLHRHGLAVGQARAVHLTDRGAGERLVFPRGKQLLDRRAELCFDQRADGFGRRARRRAAQSAQGFFVHGPVRLGHEAVDVAHGLAELGGQAAHVAEHLCGALGDLLRAARHQHVDRGARSNARQLDEAPETTGGQVVVFGHAQARLATNAANTTTK
jgi:hypothetical protein